MVPNKVSLPNKSKMFEIQGNHLLRLLGHMYIPWQYSSNILSWKRHPIKTDVGYVDADFFRIISYVGTET